MAFIIFVNSFIIVTQCFICSLNLYFKIWSYIIYLKFFLFPGVILSSYELQLSF